MERNGLKNKKLLFGAILTTANASYSKAELRSADRKQYAKALNTYVGLIEEAKKNCQIEDLLILEQSALNYNANRAKDALEKKACIEAKQILSSIKKEWHSIQDKESVLKEHREIFDNNDFPTQPIKNLSMTNNTDSLDDRRTFH